MSETATICFRLNKKQRDDFATLCKSRGVSPSFILRVVIEQMNETKRLPIVTKNWFEDPETVDAIAQSDRGEGKTYANARELMKDLEKE